MNFIKKLYPDADKRGVTAAFAMMAVSVLLCMLRMLFYEDINDDLVYRFIVTDGYGVDDSPERVKSIADVIVSQCAHWYVVNGRFLLHTLVQIFDCLLGRGCFSVCTSLVILAVELMLWHYAMRRNSRYPVLWAVAVSVSFVMLYLTVRNWWLLQQMAYSFNYVWPLLVVLPFISKVQRVASGEKVGRWGGIGCAVLALLTGCTQEVFICPLCGATFVLLLRNLMLRRRVSWMFVIMCLCLWLGTASVVFAPGTLHRGAGLPWNWLKSVLYEGALYLSELPLLWMAVAIVSCYCIKYGFRAALRLCPFEALCLALAVMMSLVLHTGSQAFSGVNIFSLMVCLRYGACLLGASMSNGRRRKLRIVSLSIFVLFVAYQVYFIASDIRLCNYNRGIVESYIASPDGIVAYTPSAPSRFTWGNVDFSELRENYWLVMSFKMAYGKRDKELFMLTDDEKDRFASIPGNDSIRVPGDAGFYYLTDVIVVKPINAEERFESLKVVLKKAESQHPLDVIRLKWRKYRGACDPATEETIVGEEYYCYRICHTRYGDFACLFLPEHPVSIDRL